MAVIPASPTFKNIQAILDAILANSNFEGSPPPTPLDPPAKHGIFWKKTGNYDVDYNFFTTGSVPGVQGGTMPIMNTQKGSELRSNFFVVLTVGLPGIGQMPDMGPFITDKNPDGSTNYQIQVNGVNMTGDDIQDTVKFWLLNNFPK